MEGQTDQTNQNLLKTQTSQSQPSTRSTPSPAAVNPIEGALIILIPLGFALGVALGRRYANYRRKQMLQRQIQWLEKLWEINSNNSRR